ncbi:hypothetical protein [Flavobacterium capsici]|uniref:TonB-dependent receptor plug domain-containing protein n=1 Tax=Flavobacterium capsici TaxID=3075618 RepID=A0AA96EVZ6_9FLAO|nr:MULTISPECIES: hypothetical protein [unclassified Flavobacterium]WNM18952.1 hypothetical protein RN608_13175 [Flavobacterium sp. PMR2A8]WNM23002.1 hypothetical protein RN605_06475 [Flavobacterium sp. PMTSA4]
MDHKDDIFEQFKSAAENAETKEFPAMESVWNRVESKLDNKQLTKETKLWKKLAVAASLLLVATLGYQFLKEDKTVISPTNEMVAVDTLKTVTDSVSNEAIVSAEEKSNPVIKPNAEMILEEQIGTTNNIVMQDTIKSLVPKMAVAAKESQIESDALELQKPAAASLVANGYTKQKDNARGVRRSEGYFNAETVQSNDSKQVEKKEEPLLVIDNKVSDQQTVGKLDAGEIDNILVLPDPLYIINGVEYTEVELFGPNPTSPYAPLNKQNIESLSILQNEKATSIYGDKGKKGVVIITTKDGKPAAKK